MKHWKVLTIALALTSLAACSSAPTQPEKEIKFEPPVMEQETEESIEEVVEIEEPKYIEEEPEVIEVEPKPLPTKMADGKLILGGREWVYFPEFNHYVKATVDSNTDTSSLSAVDVVKFERDGKSWVKFKAAHSGKNSKEISLPVERWVKMKAESNIDEADKHPVVTVWIQLGELKQKTEFTLVDRSQLDLLVLLGQSFVQDVAIVDVSRTFVQPKAKN